jgi:hypothetical protein
VPVSTAPTGFGAGNIRSFNRGDGDGWGSVMVVMRRPARPLA